MVRVFNGGRGFNPRSSYIKDSKNGTPSLALSIIRHGSRVNGAI